MSTKKMPNKTKVWRKSGEGRASRVTSNWNKPAMYPLLEKLFANANITVSSRI